MGVSEKTARRDMAALKTRGMIEFVGPLRTGGYRLSR
jgi:DeoR/GlpR family transcriptional regulator of sugar metabolism